MMYRPGGAALMDFVDKFQHGEVDWNAFLQQWLNVVNFFSAVASGQFENIDWNAAAQAALTGGDIIQIFRRVLGQPTMSDKDRTDAINAIDTMLPKIADTQTLASTADQAARTIRCETTPDWATCVDAQRQIISKIAAVQNLANQLTEKLHALLADISARAPGTFASQVPAIQSNMSALADRMTDVQQYVQHLQAFAAQGAKVPTSSIEMAPPAAATGLSTPAKVAIGVGTAGVLGLGAWLFIKKPWK